MSSAPYSDLTLAGALSADLAGGANAAHARQTRSDTRSYTRLKELASTAHKSFTPAAAAVKPTAELPALVEAGFEDWDELLKWCRAATDARTLFVMDTQGFLIALWGEWGYDHVEAAGTQLMVAFEKSDQIAPEQGRACLLTIRAGRLWIAGVRAPAEQPEPLTLGLVLDAPMSPQLVDQVAQQITLSVPRL